MYIYIYTCICIYTHTHTYRVNPHGCCHLVYAFHSCDLILGVLFLMVSVKDVLVVLLLVGFYTILLLPILYGV